MIGSDIFFAVISSTLLVVVLIIGLLVSFFISARRRQKQELELAATKLNFEREIRQVETEVTEHIMSQFAQELHDNIGQLLTAMHIQIENQKLEHPAVAEGYKPVEIYLNEVTQQLRMLSRTLNNDFLGHIGLQAAIQLEVERLRALKRFEIEYLVKTGPSLLEKSQELMLFRVFQEITQNVLRHAQATVLQVELDMTQGFQLQVKDNGKGFDLKGVYAAGKASGLQNIIKRCHLAGLSCSIITEPGAGSLFIIKKIINLP